MIEVNENTIEEVLEMLKQKPTPLEQFRKWLPSILMVIALVGFIIAPFEKQKTELKDVKKDVETMKKIIWLKVPGAPDYMDNPFTTREMKVGCLERYYCRFAYVRPGIRSSY